MNELLFDLLVCQGSTIKLRNGISDLTVITKCLWQVESEIAKNSRQAIFDFNKLILGFSEYKLFIGSIIANSKEFRETLHHAAINCQETVYLALIPHPKEWPKNNLGEFWRYCEN